MKKPITRREAIEACVKTYIKKYPEEYKALLKIIKEKRSKMPSDSWGEAVIGLNKKDGEIRIGLKLPARMLESINEMLKLHEQDYLFYLKDTKASDKEYKWFKEAFPMFVVPEYRKRIF